jgi:hypothetical protein
MVICTDMMVSTGEISADALTIKSIPMGNWTAMYAGNDLSPIASIEDRFMAILRGRKLAYKSLSRADFVSAFSYAVRDQVNYESELELLRPYGLTLDNYRDEGPKLGDSIYNQIVYEMGQKQLQITFLCAGHESNNSGHIFSINGRGQESNYDATGFWAIGSGQMSALGYLFTSKYSIISGVADALLHVCYAKYYAESAIGVGRSTCVQILHLEEEKEFFLMDVDLEPIRALWEKRQKRNQLGDRESKASKSVLVGAATEKKAKLEATKQSAAQKSAG